MGRQQSYLTFEYNVCISSYGGENPLIYTAIGKQEKEACDA